MARARFTTEAYLDLEEIVTYIGAQNSSAAARLTDRIESECCRLAGQPGVGQMRSDLSPGLRFFPIGNDLIFYRPDVDGIQVIRVLHGARDYAAEKF